MSEDGIGGEIFSTNRLTNDSLLYFEIVVSIQFTNGSSIITWSGVKVN